MLDTAFERIVGDIGNSATFAYPVRYRVVEGASAARVVLDRGRGLLPAFIAAARELVADGALALTTSCGFLALFQRELAAAVPVPVATSALLQVGLIESVLAPGRRAGIVTASRTALTAAHLAAAGVAADTPIAGVDPEGHFHRVFVDGACVALDRAAAERDVVAAANALVAADRGSVGAIVLECTNMPPYAAAVGAATGLPVHDIRTLVDWLRAGALAATASGRG